MFYTVFFVEFAKFVRSSALHTSQIMRFFLIQLSVMCLLRFNGVSTQDVEFPLNNRENKSHSGNDTRKIQISSTTTTIQPDDDDPLFNKYPIDEDSLLCDETSDNLCEVTDHNDYPAEYIVKLIESGPLALQPFEYKMGDWNDLRSSEGCASSVRIMYPQVARDIDRHWHFIVNIGEFVQPIRVEKCLARAHKCANANFLREGVTSYCKQELGTIPLRSLDDDGKIREYNYRFPSYCKCELRIRRRKYQGTVW